MNIITAIMTAICQLFIAIFQPLFGRGKRTPLEKKPADKKSRNLAVAAVAIIVIVGSLTHVEFKSFQNELKSHDSIEIVATESVTVPEMDLDRRLPTR